MSIDEAIEKFKLIANSDAPCPRYCMLPCDKCVNESKQLAEWLELLKWYEQGMEDIPSESGVLAKDVYHAGYNKAIDDFVKEVKNLIVDLSGIRFKDIDEIAEQLKAGGKE